MTLPRALLLLAFVAVSALSCLGPIVEGDFFWHLNAGRQIMKGGPLPLGQFPTQWLGQLLIFLWWKAFGFGGIVFMRAGAYVLILIGLFVWMRRAGVRFYICLLFLLFPARMFVSIPSERPQLFSFVLFPIVLYLLESFRRDEKARSVWLIPLLMALWVNIHGGVLLGMAGVGIYFVSEAGLLIAGRTSRRRTLTFGAIAALPIAAATALNPSALKSMAATVRSVLTPGGYTASIQEYLSPLAAARGLGQYYPFYWIFLAVALVVVLWGVRRIPVHHTLMVLFMAALSLDALRFMPFFLMLSPLVAIHVPGRGEGWEKSRALYAGFAAALLVWVLLTPMKARPQVSEDFPRQGAAFLKKLLPRASVFNYHGWSGYLTWELDGREVFLPTEGITPERDEAYEIIVWADKGRLMGKAQWNALLKAYGIDVVMMPGISQVSGEAFPLIDELYRARDWFLIYSDGVANIYARDVPRNFRVIGLYSLPKSNAFQQIVKQARRQLKEYPKRKVLWRSLGDAYKKLGKGKEAREAYSKGGIALD